MSSVAERQGGSPLAEGERWAREHGEIDLLIGELAEAVLSQSVEYARTAVAELSLAMDAHFAAEEEIYFTLVGGINPAFGAEIEGACKFHEELRGRLHEIRVHLDESRLRSARQGLIALLKRLRQHEREEALLLQALRAIPQS
jgi:hypothetical protein